jgi:hypothetical protein
VSDTSALAEDRAPPLGKPSLAAIGAALTISLATALLAGLDALPNGDDFCRASLQQLPGLAKPWQPVSSSLAYAVESWQLWTGRWASMWLESSVLSAVNITRAYPAALLGVWLIVLASFAAIVSALLPRTVGRGGLLLGTLLLFAIFWLNMPEPGEAFFWFTGAVENVLPVGLGGAAVALLATAHRRTRRARFLQQSIAAVASIIVPGLHELFGALLVAVLAMAALLVGRRDRTRAAPWLICLALVVLSETVVMAAPGNALRANALPSTSTVHVIKLTVLQLLHYVPDWCLSGSLLAATLALFAYRPLRAAEWPDEYLKGWRIALVPALTFALPCLMLGAATYALRLPLAGRTIAGLYLVFLLGWFLSVAVLARRLDDRLPSGPPLNFSLSVLAATLVLQGNTRAAIFDLHDKTGAWHSSMTARYAALHRKVGSAAVLVPPAAPVPSFIFWRDIQENPRAFRNICVARYFRVGAVALRPTGAPG